ncbi:serine hydrolase [Streptomyces sp. NPDC058964]|uniref:serine hydrolase n=1 Tax=Streptomyces sp. NPDC058964 TaxID=3346681 RepID=UPI0036C09C3A
MVRRLVRRCGCSRPAADGVLGPDRRVASYRQDLAAEGKGGITRRELLAHRAGVTGLDAGCIPEEPADDRVGRGPPGWPGSARSGSRGGSSVTTGW